MPTVSVIIPVYRSEATLRDLYGQLAAALTVLVPVFEIVFVEDGGGDEAWAVIAAISKADRRVRGLRMSRNYGQHNALLAGIRAARHEVILTMDDDLQHPVSEIAAMLAALDDRHDLVYGVPQTSQHGTLRVAGSHLVRLALASAMGARAARNVSAFRAFRTRLRDGFDAYSSPYVSIDVLLSWVTTRTGAIKVLHAPRRAGVSGYSLGRLVQHAFNLLTGFSVVPLQIASVLGFLSVLLGLTILLIVLVNYLIRGSAVPGFAFLASMIAIFSGAQLFSLGIFGEYLARIHFRSMNRPSYVIGETTADSSAANGARSSDV